MEENNRSITELIATFSYVAAWSLGLRQTAQMIVNRWSVLWLCDNKEVALKSAPKWVR